MSTILVESTLSLHDACRLLPSSRAGKKLNLCTIWRWITGGVRAIDGTRVRLEAVRVGGRWLTSREAIERFSASLTGTPTEAAPIRTPAARQRAAEAAQKKLTAIGV